MAANSVSIIIRALDTTMDSSISPGSVSIVPVAKDMPQAPFNHPIFFVGSVPPGSNVVVASGLRASIPIDVQNFLVPGRLGEIVPREWWLDTWVLSDILDQVIAAKAEPISARRSFFPHSIVQRPMLHIMLRQAKLLEQQPFVRTHGQLATRHP